MCDPLKLRSLPSMVSCHCFGCWTALSHIPGASATAASCSCPETASEAQQPPVLPLSSHCCLLLQSPFTETAAGRCWLVSCCCRDGDSGDPRSNLCSALWLTAELTSGEKHALLGCQSRALPRALGAGLAWLQLSLVGCPCCFLQEQSSVSALGRDTKWGEVPWQDRMNPVLWS